MATRICSVCKGSGKQRLQATILTAKGGTPTQTLEISCIWCEGTGRMTARQANQLAAFEDAWCQCGNRSGHGNFYRNPDGSHGWTCPDCGKLIQTG